MWDFLRAGGPIMWILVGVSVVAVTFIIERGLALRWGRVVPSEIFEGVEKCRTKEDVPRLVQICLARPSPISRLILHAAEHLSWPKQENVDSIETRARHEVIQLERGIVVLEIVVGIGPLLGLVGTLHGLISLFASLGTTGISDNAALARGISIALNTTFMGLIVAIPSLVAWSYYNKKVENLAVEMESVCDRFLREQYRDVMSIERSEPKVAFNKAR
jgi:biopolymer transport protein ExbB